MKAQFDLSLFEKKLATQWVGQSMCYFEELESTNTYTKKAPDDKVRQGMICLTDNQTRGRGQYERAWESETSKNLTFSLVFKPPTPRRFHVLTLACALAIVEQLDHFFQQNYAYIKWPNDVMLNNRKVAGLLAETVFTGNKLDRLVIGIGLNVNQKNFSSALSDKATSLSIENDGQPVNREEFLCELLKRIEYKYNLWQRGQSSLIKSINRKIEGYGQWIGLIVDDTLLEQSYKLLGIDEAGRLLVLDHDGGIESFSYEQIRLVTD